MNKYQGQLNLMRIWKVSEGKNQKRQARDDAQKRIVQAKTVSLKRICKTCQSKRNSQDRMLQIGKKKEKIEELPENLQDVSNKISECTGEVLPHCSEINSRFISSNRTRRGKSRKDGGSEEGNNCCDKIFAEIRNKFNLINDKRCECTGKVLPKFSKIKLGVISSNRTRLCKIRKDGGTKGENNFCDIKMRNFTIIRI